MSQYWELINIDKRQELVKLDGVELEDFMAGRTAEA